MADPDTYWFVCDHCDQAFQSPDAAAFHEDSGCRARDSVAYVLVDGSVVDDSTTPYRYVR